MKNFYYKTPHFIQNTVISFYNTFMYYKRKGGNYKSHLKYIKNNDSLSTIELVALQAKSFKEFIKKANQDSSFYKDYYKNIDIETIDIKSIDKLPIVNKEVLRNEINKVYTIPKNEGRVSKTGGTTGKSLEVVYTKDDIHKRTAFMDNFRQKQGYKLGKRTAWFSGKNLLSQKDVLKNRFWKTDFINHVRFYSTFHIHQTYLEYYLQNLIKFKPEYMVGFPSTMMEIAKYGIKHNINFPENTIKAIFPTAETITTEIRTTLSTFFKTKVFDQYASSEGAPMIFECKQGNLHLELQTGVFEVLNDNNQPDNEGRLVLTSFTTNGTPLIRYDIGDRLKLSNNSCNCGNNNPLVDSILGRIDDFVYSPINGKINLGNVSNALKGTVGIIKFQVIQDVLNAIVLKVVVDNKMYSPVIEKKFIKNWKERVGNEMGITIDYVEDIPVENSGKFRFVKNNIKHLLD